ncbi:MAG TPA: long-chain-fatty-acid--CoA ligase [Gammaproteobacteria bacterium]|nr:long-chain-fatty-acid--CoA ligase [Gammaproteobacteria bacterium]
MILTQLPEENLARFGEYPFLYFGDQAYSNREVLASADAVAAVLSQHGLEQGDRVLVCMPNCPEVFFAYQGIMRAGSVVVPVMHVLHPQEIGFIAADSEAKAIITAAAVLPNVLKATEGLEPPPLILVAGLGRDNDRDNIRDLHSAMAQAPMPPVRPTLRAEDVAVILYTSGTTGAPKGVLLTHRNLYSNAAAAVSLSTDLDRGTTISVLPLAHIYGFTTANVLYLRGDTVVILPKYELRAVCQAIEAHRVKRFSAVPAMIHNMVTDPATAEYDLSSLESVGCGSAPLPVRVIEAFKDKFGAEIYEGYGLSEAAPTVSAHRRGEPIKPGSVGRAFPGVEIRIVDDQGREVPTGEAGELIVRGDNVSPGYFRNEQASREALRDGWLHTGDIARVDADGYLFIVDRKKDLIIRGGFNIYPRDLEEILVKHPAVAEVAVVGAPSEEMGEEVVAFVVRKDGASAEENELIRYCQEKLAKYKTPRRIVFIEALPRNGVGKVLKKVLREQVGDLRLLA